MPEPPDTQTPHCPRCAYDLTGQTAASSSPADFPSPLAGEGGRAQRDRERGLGRQPPPAFSAWTHACPLTATCPECGLTFDWADLLKPSRQRIPWLYEHANHWWDVRRTWGTCVRALAPWWFWKRVMVVHRVRPARLVAFVILCVLCGEALLCTAGVADCAADWSRTRPFVVRTGRPQLTLGAHLERYGVRAIRTIHREVYWNWRDGVWFKSRLDRVMPYTRSSPLMPLGFAVAAAVIVAAAPSEWRRKRIRPVHLVRIVVYSLSPPLVLLAAAPAVGILVSLVDWGFGMSGALTSPSWLTSLRFARGHLMFERSGAHLLCGLMIVWQSVFWACALRVGMRLERPWSLWSLATIGGLAAAFCVSMACELM